jgi:hypothetical protein
MSCFVAVEDSRSDKGIAGGGDTAIIEVVCSSITEYSCTKKAG